MSRRRSLEGFAYNIAQKFSTSWEHIAWMSLENREPVMTVDLLTGGKKLEGKQFSSFYPSELLTPNDVRVSKDKDGNILLVGPLMGLNARLGTSLIVYEPEKLALN